MPDDPTSLLPASEKPPRNITGKMIAIMLLILGGFAVVITAYYVADNYPIFDDTEPTTVTQEHTE